eukprot:1016546-Lingulodinium_polyedra.AAC.1
MSLCAKTKSRRIWPSARRSEVCRAISRMPCVAAPPSCWTPAKKRKIHGGSCRGNATGPHCVP